MYMKEDDEIKTKMIKMIRAYLHRINSPQKPALETYTLNELREVCFLYKIDIRSCIE